MEEFYNHHIRLEKDIDANTASNERSIRAGTTAQKLLQTYMDGYKIFWQTPRDYGLKDCLTMQQMQAVLYANPQAMGEILMDGAAFVQFIMATYPEKIGTDFFPTRYLTSPYEMDGLTLISLKPEWEYNRIT